MSINNNYEYLKNKANLTLGIWRDTNVWLQNNALQYYSQLPESTKLSDTNASKIALSSDFIKKFANKRSCVAKAVLDINKLIETAKEFQLQLKNSGICVNDIINRKKMFSRLKKAYKCYLVALREPHYIRPCVEDVGEEQCCFEFDMSIAKTKLRRIKKDCDVIQDICKKNVAYKIAESRAEYGLHEKKAEKFVFDSSETNQQDKILSNIDLIPKKELQFPDFKFELKNIQPGENNQDFSTFSNAIDILKNNTKLFKKFYHDVLDRYYEYKKEMESLQNKFIGFYKISEEADDNVKQVQGYIKHYEKCLLKSKENRLTLEDNGDVLRKFNLAEIDKDSFARSNWRAYKKAFHAEKLNIADKHKTIECIDCLRLKTNNLYNKCKLRYDHFRELYVRFSTFSKLVNELKNLSSVAEEFTIEQCEPLFDVVSLKIDSDKRWFSIQDKLDDTEIKIKELVNGVNAFSNLYIGGTHIPLKVESYGKFFIRREVHVLKKRIEKKLKLEKEALKKSNKK